MSTLELMLEWARMSVWMMGPLALILAARTRQNFGFVLISVASFLAVWVTLSFPIGLGMSALHIFDHRYISVVLLVIAGAYQFSREHENAVLNCMKTSDTNLYFGLRTGWTCFVACGPLMVAAFGLMPNTPWLMAGITVVMVAEFISSNRLLVARSIGLISAVAAIGILFLAGPVSFGDFPTIGHHH
jgi:predicted metal-binding membrane protein